MIEKVSKVKQAILFACCLAATGCKQAPQATVESGYKVITLAPTDRTLSSTYSATIRGRQDIEIYPQVSGTLTQVCVSEGERVKRGQSLFIIDQVPYEAALQTALANVEAAKASLATAQLTYDSKQELYKQNVVSAFDLSTAKNSLLAAQAQLAQMKAQEVNARNNLSYTLVKSPADGVVGTLPYRVGTLVSASLPEPLTTVSDNSDMYVYFSMTENQLLGLIRQYGSKDKALQSMPAIELVLNDRTTYEEKGTIATISGVVDASTGTVSVRSSGNVVVPSVYKDGIIIPRAATYEVQDKVFVYKVVDGKTHSTQVSVERVDGGQDYIVTTGLAIGDEIVTEGVGLLQDGMPITKKKQLTQN